MAYVIRLLGGVLLVAAWMLCAGSAAAHVALRSPEPRLAGDAGGNQLKNGPCGQTTDGRTETVSVFQPGETITVEWEEFINHPSYYRISFDVDGDDDFPVRANMDQLFPGTTSASEVMAMDDPEAAEPLSDVILQYVHEEAGNSGPTYSTTVTLPNVQCENCTLQLIQFMYDKQGDNNDNEYYFQCADIALRGDVVDSSGAGGMVGDTGGADGSGGISAGGSDGMDASGTGGSAVASGAGGSASGMVGGAVSAGGAMAASTTTGTGGMQAGTGGSAMAGTGADGQVSTGTTGMTGMTGSTGSTGTTGSTGAQPGNSGGGCSLAGHRQGSRSSPVWLVLGALSLLGLGRRRD